MTLTFTIATPEQIPTIVDVINGAYRPAGGRGGWTNETHLVAGARTDADQLAFLMQNPNTRLIVASIDSEIIGSVYIAQDNTKAHIGMLGIHCNHQSKGHGSALLKYAEKLAFEEFGVMQVASLIVSDRPEINSFVQKRNYVFTNQTMAYPIDAGVGIPKSDSLELHLYIKNFTTDVSSL